MILERFQFVAACPRCGAVDTHDMAEPHIRPTIPPLSDMTPAARCMRLIAGVMDTLQAIRGIEDLYDPPGTEVARICRSCTHRWGQR
jgi:hypothetical protein